MAALHRTKGWFTMSVVSCLALLLGCSSNRASAFTSPTHLQSWQTKYSYRQQPSGGALLRNRATSYFSTFANDTITVDGDEDILPSQTYDSHETKRDEESNRKRLNSLANVMSEKIGKIDEGRLAFPELASGEVPRMFSSLEYTKSKDGKVVAAKYSASSSTLGAAALIAGSTLGAGVLAIPSASVSCGFMPSVAALGLAWWYMAMSGLLIAELSVNRMGVTGRPVGGLLELFQSSLGKPWGIVGGASYFFLNYAVMVACISQGGATLDGVLDAVGLDTLNAIPGIGQLLFAGVCGLRLYVSNRPVLEKANNLFLAGSIATFLGIMAMSAGGINFETLLNPVNQHPEQVVDAFPILFLSMAYQNIVPNIVTKLEGDRSKITNAIIGGTSVPLILYVCWNALVLGNPSAFVETTGGPAWNTFVAGFSELVLVMSMLSVSKSLLDTLQKDYKSLPSNVSFPLNEWKPVVFAGVLLPPLFVALSNPDIFHQALDFSGAFGVSTLFLVLPPVLVWKERYGEEEKPIFAEPMVPLGKIPLASMWKAAATLIVEQGAEKMGVFDFVRDHIHL